MGVSPPKSTHTEIEPQTRYDSMNGENRPRITDELGEFERDVNQLKLKTLGKLSISLGGFIGRHISIFFQQKPKDVNMQPGGLQNTMISICPKISPGHSWYHVN